MMKNLVLATQLRIFVFDAVQAVRTGSDDFFDLVIIHGFHVFTGQHLKQHFVSGTSCQVTGTFFL